MSKEKLQITTLKKDGHGPIKKLLSLTARALQPENMVTTSLVGTAAFLASFASVIITDPESASLLLLEVLPAGMAMAIITASAVGNTMFQDKIREFGKKHIINEAPYISNLKFVGKTMFYAISLPRLEAVSLLECLKDSVNNDQFCRICNNLFAQDHNHLDPELLSCIKEGYSESFRTVSESIRNATNTSFESYYPKFQEHFNCALTQEVSQLVFLSCIYKELQEEKAKNNFSQINLDEFRETYLEYREGLSEKFGSDKETKKEIEDFIRCDNEFNEIEEELVLSELPSEQKVAAATTLRQRGSVAPLKQDSQERGMAKK